MNKLFLFSILVLCVSANICFADTTDNNPKVDKFVSSTTVEVTPSPLAQLTELAVKGKRSGVKQKPKNNTYSVKKRQIEKDYQTRSSWF